MCAGAFAASPLEMMILTASSLSLAMPLISGISSIQLNGGGRVNSDAHLAAQRRLPGVRAGDAHATAGLAAAQQLSPEEVVDVGTSRQGVRVPAPHEPLVRVHVWWPHNWLAD